ncbi:MAG: hypothetical protein NT116_01975 [Candidatus Parcubacteria bacterium]|nr:hypothetical protein [Candidatus Parcubacteria bacterium]
MRKESLTVIVLEGVFYIGVILLGIWVLSVFSGSYGAIIRIPSSWAAIILAISITAALTSEFVRWLQKEQRIQKMKKGHKAFVKNY